MKALLTAAALAGLLALSGCAAASEATAPSPSSPAASPSGMAEAQSSASAAAAPTTQAAQAAQAAGSLPGKAHFKGDYALATAADSAEIIDLSKQWYSPEKKAALKAKMDAEGLMSNIPAEIAPTWFARAAVSCQAVYDGHPMPVDGVYAKINTLILTTYCPELG